MVIGKRRVVEGWIEKADNQLQTAKGHLSSYGHHPDAIQASQECVELSIKAILTLLGIEYPPRHAWGKKDFEGIAKQIQERNLLDKFSAQGLGYSVRLPRLLFLGAFWGQFYLPAKYGFETEYLAAPQDLFERDEAELALRHAEECLRAALALRYLAEDKLGALLS